MSSFSHSISAISNAHTARSRFVEGWNFYVSGRRRATATPEWFEGWNAARDAAATAPLRYPDLSDIRLEMTGE